MALTVTIVYPVGMSFEDKDLPANWSQMTTVEKQSWLLDRCADIVGAGKGDDPVIQDCSDPTLID